MAGTLPTTSLRRLISPLSRSRGLVLWSLAQVLGGELHIGKHISFGVIHQFHQLGHAWPQLIGYLAPLLARCLCIVPSEGGAAPGRDDTSLALAGVGHGVAHEVNPAPLPCGADYFADRCLQSFMGVGDDQLDAAQTTPG
jgi:hypothetical protein